jgi:hypothetical protein
MLKFLLILFFIPPILFLLLCIEIIKNGEKSDVYKKVFTELKNYSKDNGINVDDDAISQEIYRTVRRFMFIMITIIMIMFVLFCLAI